MSNKTRLVLVIRSCRSSDLGISGCDQLLGILNR